MFSDFAVGMYFAIGFGGWVFFKMQRKTGGNNVNSFAVAFGAGLISFLVLFTLLGIFF